MRYEYFTSDDWWQRRTHLDNGYLVSTVWLAYDRTRVRYETMVFGEGSSEDLLVNRYSSKRKAIKDHKRIVRLVRKWNRQEQEYDYAD
jgi:hypothetical protein